MNQQFIPAQLKIHLQKIIDILPYNHLPVDHDFGNHRLVPGFIDNHIHGAFGIDTNDGDEEGLKRIMQGIADGNHVVWPATLLKLNHKKGKLAYNYDADIVVLDSDYEV